MRVWKYWVLSIVAAFFISKDALAQLNVCIDEGSGWTLKDFPNPVVANIQVQNNGAIPLWDEDGDSFVPTNPCNFGAQGDCNDQDATVYPGAPELCNDGIDNDCDGSIDCDDTTCSSENDCQICDLFSYPEVSPFYPMDTLGYKSSYRYECSKNDIARHWVTLYTHGKMPDGSFRLAQLRLCLTYDVNNPDYNYLFTVNGEAFDTNGDYHSQIPGRRETNTFQRVAGCGQLMKNWVGTLNIVSECWSN